MLRALGAAAAVSALLGPATIPAAGAVDTPAIESYPVPADGVFRITGAGWGHGRGMSQWGAYQAATEGRTHAEILAFYYPGTVLAPLPAATVRVLVAGDTGRDLIVRATPGLVAQQQAGEPVTLPDQPGACASPATRWRVRADGSGMALAAWCGAWRTVDRVSGPSLTFTSPEGIVATQNGAIRRGYRGAITANRTGARSVQVVNTLPMEEYLRPVVAAEVSPSWPDEALRAQAVAARSYAAHEALGRTGRAFDVYDSTRSQAYPGAVAYDAAWRVVRVREHARTDAAIAATAGIHVTVGGVPALTQFSSSNGGGTAASPLPHMVAQPDEWDARAVRNPRLSWTDSVSAAALAKRYPGAGGVVALEVLARDGAGPWGGRVSALRVVGAQRSYVLASDGAIRAALGVNSSLLTLAPPAAVPAAQPEPAA